MSSRFDTRPGTKISRLLRTANWMGHHKAEFNQFYRLATFNWDPAVLRERTVFEISAILLDQRIQAEISFQT